MHEAIKIVLQWHGPLTVQELTAIINERELYEGDGNLLPVRQVSEKVSINYKKPNQEDLSVLTVEQAEKYIAEVLCSWQHASKGDGSSEVCRFKTGQKSDYHIPLQGT